MKKLLLAAAVALALAGSAHAQNVDFSAELSAHARAHPIGQRVHPLAFCVLVFSSGRWA
jgi:hypothetical protein